MPPQAPTSFIPKKPLDTGNAYHESGGVGILFFIALFIFIASLVAAGGVFAYENFLNSSIASKTASLNAAEGAFDLNTIDGLIKLDSRINNANALLSSHVAPSAIFNLLGAQTLPNVQFTSFQYTLQSDNSASIVLAGVADSFSTVALQSDQFGAVTSLKDVVFSDVQINTNGTVTFSVAATVSPSLINYAKNLGVAPAPIINTAPATSTTPSTGSGQATN
jgi:hypothetical protein